MRRVHCSALAAAALMLVSAASTADAQAAGRGGAAAAARGAEPNDSARKVAGGGITILGWMGKIDAKEEQAGMKLENSKLEAVGDALHVVTGPAVTYWLPSNEAKGDYEVSATFREPKYMELNDHPHPYGIVIGGNDLGTENQSYLYCAAYGNGNFIVRGFGPAPFQVNGRRGEAHPAVNKAAAKGAEVTQTIKVVVHGNQVMCSINGTVVGTYEKSAIVGPGKIKSTDGVYGIRFAHNTEAFVTGLKMVKH